MDSGMITIAVIMIAVVIIPVFLITASSKKKSKQLFNQLQQLALENSSKLTKSEIKNKFSLGLDEVNQKLFFIKKSADTDIIKVINLKNVRACNIIKQVRMVKLDKTLNEIIEKVGLSLVLNNHTTEYLGFYNEDESIQISGEFALAEQWKTTLDALLKNGSVLPKETQNISKDLAFS